MTPAGAPTRFFGAISDVSSDFSALRATLSFTDGLTLPLALNPDGSFSIDRVFATAGQRVAALRLVDADGGTASQALNLTVTPSVGVPAVTSGVILRDGAPLGVKIGFNSDVSASLATACATSSTWSPSPRTTTRPLRRRRPPARQFRRSPRRSPRSRPAHCRQRRPRPRPLPPAPPRPPSPRSPPLVRRSTRSRHGAPQSPRAGQSWFRRPFPSLLPPPASRRRSPRGRRCSTGAGSHGTTCWIRTAARRAGGDVSSGGAIPRAEWWCAV
jgi:hypothetical protein